MKHVKLVVFATVVGMTGAPLVLFAAAVGGAANRAPSTRGVIVWTNRANDGSEHLLIARADGSHQRVLTPSVPDAADIDAQVSPRGSWIAYERDTSDAASIHLVRPNGADDHVLDVGCDDPCVAAASPTWISNRRLAFALVVGPFDPQTGDAASAVLWSARSTAVTFAGSRNAASTEPTRTPTSTCRGTAVTSRSSGSATRTTGLLSSAWTVTVHIASN